MNVFSLWKSQVGGSSVNDKVLTHYQKITWSLSTSHCIYLCVISSVFFPFCISCGQQSTLAHEHCTLQVLFDYSPKASSHDADYSPKASTYDANAFVEDDVHGAGDGLQLRQLLGAFAEDLRHFYLKFHWYITCNLLGSTFILKTWAYQAVVSKLRNVSYLMLTLLNSMEWNDVCSNETGEFLSSITR